MKITVKLKNRGYTQMLDNVKNVQNKEIRVGYHDAGKQTMLALVHEFGCRIPVTAKMRAWFMYQGVFLKKSTKVIVIPERSFLRAGFDDRFPGIFANHSRALGYVMVGQMPSDAVLQALALEVKGELQNYAVQLSSPKNVAFTTNRKGSSNPLVDTGQMIGAMSYKIK